MRYRSAKKRDVLSSEAESFIKNGKLKKSSKIEKDSELVRKLIDSNLEEATASHEQDQASRVSDESPYELDPEKEGRIAREFKNLVTRTEAEENRERIRSVYGRSRWFLYLLREYSRIKDFSRKTRVVSCTLIPPRVSLNPAMKIALDNDLKDAARRLRQPLEHAAGEGWRFLGKLEYNLLRELAALCRQISVTNFRKISTSDSKLLSLRKLETCFLTCHYQQDYPHIMKAALGAVLEREKRFEDDLPEFTGYVDFILLERKAPSSLYNFIVGVNMVRYRRYIPFTGLINYAAGGVVNTAYFNCKRKTQNRINRHIDSALNRLIQLQAEKTDIERTKLFLDFDEDGEPDFQRLYDFIDKSSAAQKVRAERELQDMPRFTLLLFSSFLKEAAVFLNGTVEFDTGVKARIFAEDYFKFEIERLRYSITSLEEMQDSVPSLSRIRFLGLREAGTAGGPHETEFLRLAAALVSFIVSIGKKLMHIKLSQKTSTDYEAVTTSVDPRAAYYRIIPYQDSILKSGGVLDGMYVLEAITYLVSLCHLIGLIYADPSVTVLLGREKPGEIEIAGLVNALERLADPLQFQKIQEIHELDS